MLLLILILKRKLKLIFNFSSNPENCPLILIQCLFLISMKLQPHEMIEQITAFTRQATDIKFKLSQITHLKLDMSSAEAVKRLKGKKN